VSTALESEVAGTHRLQAALSSLPVASRYRVAYSGGLDSHLLLAALVEVRDRLPGPIDALHVNHGLNPSASQWAEHCRQVCLDLDVALHSVTVDARPRRGESPEAAARRARYAMLAEFIEAGDCLLTAHHQDDQAETVLLQLLRGCGPHGLAAMPRRAAFSRGIHVRPLLGFTRAELHDFALQRGLRWVEDPSNFDTGLRRNMLRHEILPLLARHWPAYARTLTRDAVHQAEAAGMLDDLAAIDFECARGKNANVVSARALRELTPARQRNLLRYWLRRLGHARPNSVHVERILADVVLAAPDTAPCVTWGNVEVRRYRDAVIAMLPLPDHDSDWIVPWDLGGSLELPSEGGRLTTSVTPDGGIRPSHLNASVSVRYRRGGERCRLAAGAHRQELKTLLQDWGVPPWLRDRVPLIYVGEQLAAVADLCVCAPFQSEPGEPGIEVHWRRGPGFAF